ncbi:L-aspartate oxidase [Ilumatobacter sp.]|uniref:L-aspartate oxidase n=1 Tax=Ilumatobacter sp. TaxID=1967498 RepID=UPI003AF9045B
MSFTLPSTLAAPEATWERSVDVVVLGSGASGLAAARAVRPGRSVLVVTKDVLAAGSTAWAQGGLAAVLDPTDSIEHHVADTLAAGAGLCDESAVRTLATEAPTAIRRLIELGAMFDPDETGEMALTMEGGHSHRRVVHSGGDQSGREVQKTLDSAAVEAGVELLEHAFALDLIVARNTQGHRQAGGVRVALLDEQGTVQSVGVVRARAVVIATGGYGQVFASTSNPPALTGDGLALAMRAGLAARNAEFVQFHPSVLWIGADARGQQALVSEAVRGEGAVLFDGLGRRVMAGVHPLEDLAPRDVVAAAISRRMAEAPGGVGDHVFLDATHLGEEFYDRFPSITASCRAVGVDPARDRIPVAPAAHYACGGVPADLDGVTEMPGLFAIGEVSCTGVHGANRLASNSVTEGIVAGMRLGAALAADLPVPVDVDADAGRFRDAPLRNPAQRVEMRSVMSSQVGVLRTPGGLSGAVRQLEALATTSSVGVTGSRAAWEATNMLTVAAAVATAASARTESRGCHRRDDWPERRAAWVTELEVRLTIDGDLVVTGIPHA